MLPKCHALSVRASMPSGTTEPCIFQCTDSEGEPRDLVVKFNSTIQCNPSHEIICALLAEYFGISTPKPALVRLSPELAQATVDKDISHRILASARKFSGLNFATEYLTGNTTVPLGYRIPPDLHRNAVKIIAFDLLVDNTDRKKRKPNLLIQGDKIHVIDHEATFGYFMLIGASPEPFQEDFSRLTIADHPLAPVLKAETDDYINEFVDQLDYLNEEIIDAVLSAVPQEYEYAHLDKVRDWLLKAKQRVNALRRCLYLGGQ